MNKKDIHQNLMRTALVPDGTNMTRWSVMLAVVMIAMLAMPMEARADGFSWDAGTKTLTVTGTDIANNPAWPIVIGGTSVEKTDVEHLVVGSGVSSIGEGAFKNCTNLKTTSLSNDVRSMGASAFYDCTSLTTINIPQNEDFTRIQNDAFSGCNKLTTITLPNNVATIGDRSFYGCSGLTSVDLGLVEAIGSYAFYNCFSLPTISLPNTLTLQNIGDNAFASCTSLQTVRTFYFNENNFGNRVFPQSMKGVIIPSLITNITKAEVLATFPSVEYKGHVFYEGSKSKCEQAFHESFSVVDQYYRTYFVGGRSYIHWLCTATFDTQGMATNPAPVTNVWAGWDEVKCGSEPTTTGYDFDGWYRDEACTELFGTTKEVDGQTVTTYSGVIPGDVTLYAKWKPNIYYTVSFDTGGKCSPPSLQEISLNKTAKEPNVLYYYNKDDGKDYCTEGWYTDKGCTQRYDFNTPVDHSFTLYAKWALATKRQAFVSLTYAGEGCYATLIDANGQEFWNFESGYVPPGLYTINIISGKYYDESNYTGSIVYVPRPDQNGQSQSGESQEGQSQSGESQEGQSQAEDSQAGESQTGTSTGGEGNDPSEGGSTEAVPTVTNFKYNGMRSIDLNLDLTSHDAYITINCICINPDHGGVASPPEGGHVTYVKAGRTTGGIYNITFTPNEGYVFVRYNLSKTTGTGSGALTPASATTINYEPTSGPKTVTITAPYTDSDHSITYGVHFDPVFEKSSVAPFITTQPLGLDLPQGYTSGHVLTVAARTEEGQLSYQWYQSTKNIYERDVTAIDGATEPSYAIPAGLPAGTTFYFCRVTASNGTKSVYANSHIVAVNVGTATTRAFTTPDTALPAAGGTASAGIATGTRGEDDTPPAELSGKFLYGLDWAVSKSAGSDEYDVLTISGSGAAMRSVSQSDYPWYGYRGTIKSIVVGDGVPNIGNEAFKDFTGVTSLVLGKDVMIIGNEAFAGLTSLASLAIGESVKIIGKSAFKDCTSLVSLDLGDGVTSIGNSAFYGCTSLESLVIGDEVALIGRYAFGGCTKLGSIVVGEKNATFDSRGECNAVIRKEINDNNVSDDTKGELVLGCKKTVIPNTVTSIGDFAFAKCSTPTTLDIPNSVTTIGEYAFEDCTTLTSVTIPASVTCINWDAFFGCTGVTDVYCYADYRKLVWYDDNCNDFMDVNNNHLKATKCHVFAKAPFDTAWGNGDKGTDVNVTFVGDLATNGPTRTITVSADPADGGTVTGGTSGTYALGTQLEFKATAAEGYRFVNWTIDGINGGSETTYPFVVNGDFSTVVAHFERIYPLTGDYVGFYDKDSNPITVAAEGETVTVSYNPYDPEDDNKVIIPSGKYFTGNYTSADGVTFTPIEGNTDATFIMPAKAVTVSAALADQEEYTLDLTTDEPQEIPESMWQLLYRLNNGINVYDDQTGERFLDLNLDGSRDVLLEEDYDEATEVSTYRATRQPGADAIKTDLRFDLTYDIPLQYNSVLFNLVVDVVDLVRAIGEGKTQAEIDAIVNAIMQKK